MAIAVLHKNELVFAEGFGKRNKDDPYTVDTIQPIGSLTKAFTATAIGELVAEGKVDWDTTPVSKYLPEFKFKDPILTSQLTFVDMLSHRTNMPNSMINWHNSREPRRELIKRLRYVEGIPRKLGAIAQYNNIMYSVAGEAAANVAGTSYEDLVISKVMRPLGLNNSGFSTTNMKKNHPDNYAMPFEALSYEAAEKGEFRMFPLNEVYLSYAPAGDAYSNVKDLVRWGKAIMDLGKVDETQVLNGASIDETLKAHTIFYEGRRGPTFGAALTYGMGWLQDSYKGAVFYHHNGAVSGFTSDLVVYPDYDLVIASTSNIVKVSEVADFLPTLIAEILLDLPRNTIDWIEEVAVPAVKEYYSAVAMIAQGALLPSKIPNKPATFANNLSAYVGEYSDPQFGSFIIRLETGNNKTTTLTYKYNEFTSTLEHYHYDAFVATLDDPLLKFKALINFSAEPISGGDKDKKKRPISTHPPPPPRH
ncbi:hypothetical protein BGZ95_001478 [Linnemannia exigua]|uniref:Beta-lactamase/transpeptidase-like protein n=1 Tax=Linnemannia exigua TaxID=604196 RepID=A0AAD4HCA2_9FUNG|nr:hypothetical protein BGZ95_001478 [Linnemannia exigua]